MQERDVREENEHISSAVKLDFLLDVEMLPVCYLENGAVLKQHNITKRPFQSSNRKIRILILKENLNYYIIINS